jgi:hypothetical protein
MAGGRATVDPAALTKRLNHEHAGSSLTMPVVALEHPFCVSWVPHLLVAVVASWGDELSRAVDHPMGGDASVCVVVLAWCRGGKGLPARLLAGIRCGDFGA